MCSKFESVYSKQEMQILEYEFSRLKGKTYLDHAGATLYAESQIKNVSKDLLNNVYSNPHTSKHTADCIDQIRFQILNHFNTNSDEYSIIFTSGATAALKLVAESFDFKIHGNGTNNTYPNASLGCFSYLQDNHTSVLGMREVITKKSAKSLCITRDEILTLFSEDKNSNHDNFLDTSESLERALFVYPAQCNFSGYKYPLKWIYKINDGILNKATQKELKKTFPKWAVILDAASFVSTNMLDLSTYKPDFVCLSFYKMFGYPTGLGALLVKNTSRHMLNNKSYYGGGTVQIALSQENFHVKRSILHESFEDGTIPFLSILAIKHGFNALNSVIRSTVGANIMEKISLHTFNLAKYFYVQLSSLHHFNGTPVCQFYADTTYGDVKQQGGIVNFNLVRSNGDFIGYAEVTHMAELFNIYIRSGCFCNPGACQRFLKLSTQELLVHYKSGHICGDNNDLINGIPTGSLRVSFGYMSTQKDADNMINMIVKCFLDNDSAKSITKEFVKLKSPNISLDKISNNSIGSGYLKSKGILREIHIYPLKSCAAFKIYKNWEIGSKGLKYDREWMIVTESGVALTQKHDTRMCIIQPSIDLENKTLILSSPGVEDIKIELSSNISASRSKSTLCQSKVCGDKIDGYDCGNAVADWLSNVLGIPGLRLIKQSDSEIRTYKKAENGTEIPISLTNKAQYLAINLSSVKWLASKIESQEFDERIENLTGRFRGNLIIETPKAFEEFSWKTIKIGNIKFQMIGPCTRCQMVCIDQESGEKTIEPLRTISKHFEGKINFGSYFSHELLNSNENRMIVCGDIVYAI